MTLVDFSGTCATKTDMLFDAWWGRVPVEGEVRIGDRVYETRLQPLPPPPLDSGGAG